MCITFHILGSSVPSSLSNAYDPDLLARVIIYGPSQFGWNFSVDGSTVFSKLFSGPGPLAETLRVSRVCCIGFLACCGMMLFAQLLLCVVRLPFLGL